MSADKSAEEVTIDSDASSLLGDFLPPILVNDPARVFFEKFNEEIIKDESSGEESSDGEISTCRRILVRLAKEVKVDVEGVTLIVKWRHVVRVLLSTQRDNILEAMRHEQQLEQEGFETKMDWGDRVVLGFADMKKALDTWTAGTKGPFEDVRAERCLGVFLLLLMAKVDRVDEASSEEFKDLLSDVFYKWKPIDIDFGEAGHIELAHRTRSNPEREVPGTQK